MGKMTRNEKVIGFQEESSLSLIISPLVKYNKNIKTPSYTLSDVTKNKHQPIFIPPDLPEIISSQSQRRAMLKTTVKGTK